MEFSSVSCKTRIPQFTLQYPGSHTEPPNLHQFFPFVSLYVCPAQMLLSSQTSSSTFPRIPPRCHQMLPPSLFPSLSSLQLAHTTLMPSPMRHAYPLLSWVCGLPHQSGLSRAQASSLWMNSPPVAHRSKLTSNDKEEYHHDRVEEAQDKAEDILMDD